MGLKSGDFNQRLNDLTLGTAPSYRIETKRLQPTIFLFEIEPGDSIADGISFHFSLEAVKVFTGHTRADLPIPEMMDLVAGITEGRKNVRRKDDNFVEGPEGMDDFGDDHIAVDIYAIVGFIENIDIVLLQEDCRQGQLLFHTCGVGTGILVERQVKDIFLIHVTPMYFSCIAEELKVFLAGNL